MLKTKSINRSQLSKALEVYSEGNFLQSSEWKALHDSINIKTESLQIVRNNTVVGLVIIIVKDAKRGRYIEVAGGPLIDWTDTEVVAFVTQNLKELAKKYDAVFVRVRPQLLQSKETEKIFTLNGYKKAPMHLHAEHTSILNLTQPEEDILKNMRRQTRYEVRKADKLGIETSSHNAKDLINQFIELQTQTAKRQGFVMSSAKFLQALAESFGDKAKIYTASKDGKVLNMGLVLRCGKEVDYFEAASDEQAYGFPGSYGLIWKAIRDAKNEGYERFNFWGISYNKDPNNRYAGVTTFKRGFGGDDIVYVPAQDLIINKGKYMFDWLIETVRRKKRRL